MIAFGIILGVIAGIFLNGCALSIISASGYMTMLLIMNRINVAEKKQRLSGIMGKIHCMTIKNNTPIIGRSTAQYLAQVGIMFFVVSWSTFLIKAFISIL